MRRTVSLLFVLSLAAVTLTAQPAIKGNVTMIDGSRLPGVTVRLSGGQFAAPRETVSATDGEFEFAAVPPGTYTVSGELAGLQPAQSDPIVVAPGKTVTVNMKMAFAGTTEPITVTAEAPLVDVSVRVLDLGIGDQAATPVVFRSKDCSCATKCPKDPKCGCCVAVITLTSNGIIERKVPEGKYYVWIPKRTGASETIIDTAASAHVSIPIERNPQR